MKAFLLLGFVVMMASAPSEASAQMQKTASQKITICKTTVPPGGMGFPFDWVNGNAGTPQPFSLNDGQCNTVDVTHLDKFNKFQEHVPSGWSLTNISCTSTTSVVKIIGANSNPAFQMGDTMVTIDLNEPNVTCTFVNRNDCRNVNLDLSTGVASWTVTPGPVGVITSLGPLTNVWVNPSPKRWIQPAALSAPQYVNGTSYVYSVPFNLPGPLNQYLGGIALTINRYAADNNVQGVSLNNGPSVATCTGSTCFSAWHGPVSITSTSSFVVGANTLAVTVRNQPGSYSGLVIDASLTAKCRRILAE